MSGILERNFMKVWFTAAGFIGCHMISDVRALAIERQDSKPRQLTVIYRRPFCPIGRVERYPTTDKLYQSAKDWEFDLSDYYSSTAEFKWVTPSPTGVHQIIYAHPNGKQLLGHVSRFWGVVVFPFKNLREKPT
jgi:hypothetical protein